ncbi:hypothetical protein P3L10_026871 [Capsicum annuum]
MYDVTSSVYRKVQPTSLCNRYERTRSRICGSMSGEGAKSSGSGSGTQTRKSVKSKSSEQSANDIGSYDGEDNQRNAPLGKGSDDGSDIEI